MLLDFRSCYRIYPDLWFHSYKSTLLPVLVFHNYYRICPDLQFHIHKSTNLLVLALDFHSYYRICPDLQFHNYKSIHPKLPQWPEAAPVDSAAALPVHSVPSY